MEKRETDGGWCKLWMQPAISKRKRKAERNLKSCISDYAFTTFSYHGPWANSYTIWPLCVCFWERESEREHLHIHLCPCLCGAVLCYQAFSELDKTCVSVSCVDFHCTIVLHCFVLCVSVCVYSLMAHDSSHTSFQHWAWTWTQWRNCCVRSCFNYFITLKSHCWYLYDV